MKRYLISFFIPCIMFSCQEEVNTVTEKTLLKKVYDGVSITPNSRLVFENIKSYQDFFNHLAQKSAEELSLWEEDISYTSLKSSGFEENIMSPTLSRIFNHEGEY